MIRVILVGAVPPPYGGVTVHLRRLLEVLRQRNIDVTLFDISGQPKNLDGVVCRRWRWVVWHLLFAPKAIVHFHNFSPNNLYLYALLGLRHTTILTLHNERFLDEIARCGGLQRRLMARAFNRLGCVIAVNDSCATLAQQIVKDGAKVRVVTGFIRPQETNRGSVPPVISDLRKQHRFLLASHAYKLAFLNGCDLYGLDLLIELTYRLVRTHGLDVATVVLLPNRGDERYYLKLLSLARELGVEERFRIVDKATEEAVPLWSIANVMVRATNTDGESLSIMEALACGTPVIASDCVRRHPAVNLFRTRDVDDLESVAFRLLSDIEAARGRVQDIPLKDGAPDLIALYEECTCR